MTTVDLLAQRARSLTTTRDRVIIGVAGSPGSGKTTLVEDLLTALRPDPPPGLAPGEWVAHVPMDGFHLADVQLDRLGLRDRKGAPETFDAAGYVALLRRLRDPAEGVVYAPGFERDLEQPIAASLHVPRAARLVLTEGNYLLLDQGPWRSVHGELDEVWFCDVPDRLRLDRLVRRHEQFGKTPSAAAAWATGTDQANSAIVEATRDRATLVVSTAGRGGGSGGG